MSPNKPYPEMTLEEEKELDEIGKFVEKVHEFRAKSGDTWGGPPYSDEEYAYAREQLNLVPKPVVDQ